MLGRLKCWLGWHDWSFKEIEPRRWEQPWGWLDATYFGTCKRCQTTNLFHGR